MLGLGIALLNGLFDLDVPFPEGEEAEEEWGSDQPEEQASHQEKRSDVTGLLEVRLPFPAAACPTPPSLAPDRRAPSSRHFFTTNWPARFLFGQVRFPAATALQLRDATAGCSKHAPVREMLREGIQQLNNLLGMDVPPPEDMEADPERAACDDLFGDWVPAPPPDETPSHVLMARPAMCASHLPHSGLELF